MVTRLQVGLLMLMIGLLNIGCEGVAEKAKEEADKAKKSAEQAVKDATDKAASAVEAAKDKSKDIAANLGDQAMALLGPLKEKISGLEALVDKPAEMKTMVTELLGTLDNNLANLPVPEGVKSGLTALKEQLTKLLEYLGGNVEAAQLQEYLKTIKEIVGSQLGS
ncbi:MAG: hypothetical protein JNL67_18315 [Planctomycetaceae bacterium]|nr:hypothetical protein [Planctomycetaceae bacterium]